MAKYRFTNKALDDLIDIWDYTLEEWSESQAQKYYDLILASCQDIAENPKFGRIYNIVSSNVLGYKCGEHIIFYHEVSTNEIVVDRVLHSMMDLKNKI